MPLTTSSIAMASKSVSTAAISLSALLLLVVTAASALAQPVAPALAPTPAGSLNISAILATGGQFGSFIRFLRATGVDDNINRQLNSSFNGLTVLAPTDNAFNSLKPGTLNSLGTQQQILLALFHVLPRYYSLAAFRTASNPLMTEAAGATGQLTLYVTADNGQVNVSTGVVVTPVGFSVYADFPLVVYSIEKVLLPYEIFGPKPPAAAPAPSKENDASPPPAVEDSGEMAPPPEADTAGASLKGREVGWSLMAGVGVLGILAAAAAW